MIDNSISITDFNLKQNGEKKPEISPIMMKYGVMQNDSKKQKIQK